MKRRRSEAPVRVTFLGSGDAFSAGGSHQAGYLLEAAGRRVLLDCGATTLAAMKRFGVAIDLDLIVISHLHGDHFAGLPFLFLEYTFEQPRRRPLCIAGPPGVAERVAALYAAVYKDLAGEPPAFPLQFVELSPDVPASFDAVAVEPFRVPHQRTDVSLGVRVSIAGRTVVYSGDTGWTEELIARSRGADLFICECCFFETRLDTHLDYPRLAEHRHAFTPKRWILTHLGREVLARRAEVEIELAHDGLCIEL